MPRLLDSDILRSRSTSPVRAMKRHFAIAGMYWLLTSTTRVDANVPQSAPTATAPTNPSVDGTGRSDADALFAEAQQHYEAGELNEALQKTLRCYELTHAVNLLHNLAVIYQQLGDCPHSLEYYRRYVREAEDDQQRANAQRHIASLSSQCDAPLAAEATPESVPGVTAPAPVPKSPPAPGVTGPSPVFRAAPTPGAPSADPASPGFQHWTTLGWVALSTGVVAGAGATYFAIGALEAQRDAKNASTSADFDDRSSALARNSTLAGVLGATSLVALGLGTYALIVAPPNKGRGSTALTLSPMPNGALVDYRVRF